MFVSCAERKLNFERKGKTTKAERFQDVTTSNNNAYIDIPSRQESIEREIEKKKYVYIGKAEKTKSKSNLLLKFPLLLSKAGFT